MLSVCEYVPVCVLLLVHAYKCFDYRSIYKLKSVFGYLFAVAKLQGQVCVVTKMCVYVSLCMPL